MAAVGGSVALVLVVAGVAFAVFTDVRTNAQTVTAATAFPTPTSPPTEPVGKLKVQSRTYDTSNPNDQITVGLRVVNIGTAKLDLGKVELDYWLTNDYGFGALTLQCLSATVGCNKVTLALQGVDPARTGADRTVEVGFKGAKLNVGKSTDVQFSVRRTTDTATLFDQGNDYSHTTRTSFGNAPEVTGTSKNVLVWGTEPPSAPAPANQMAVEYRNLDVNPIDGTIKFDLRLMNTSLTAFDARKVKLRYWFTDEKPSTGLDIVCDHASLGCGDITWVVKSLSPVRPGADKYVEIGVNLNPLLPGSSTGDIGIRLVKENSLAFDETNDYSRGTNTSYQPYQRVGAYLDGVLVWGTPP
jgi:hypothetical protein